MHFSLLGPVQVDLDGHPVQFFKTQKARALLIYLAVEARHSHSRESLMTLLWPDFSLRSAQQNLRQALYLLRRSLPVDPPPDLFRVDRLTVSWNPEIPLTLDVVQFEALAGSPDPAERFQAAGLYRGHFLEDFFLPDSEPFEEWAGSKRAYYFNLARDLMGRLADHYIVEKDWSRAEEISRRLLELDRLQEPAHRQLIETYARSGRRQDALRQYDTLRQLLRDELGLEPDPEIDALVGAIREGELKPEPSRYLPPASAQELPEVAKTRHNLPHSLVNFIGREQEIEEIENLIGSHRLVTLTGAAGIGKTNLCLKVGHRLIDEFPDGVWMVELAPVTDPAFIPKAVASAMGLSESSGRPVEDVLLDVLQDSRCLLILDNCEHLIDDAARYAESVLLASPGVKILATSLEPFDLAGEVQYPVPPLSQPESAASSTLDEWQQYDAVRLFVERARAVSPDFQVTGENYTSVVQICRRLDGIALAIELAAARVNVLSVADIAARLDDRFNLLVGGRRTAVPRQQTLRGMMEWSWDLLSQSEKTLLQRLSIFSGGMDLAAVEGVCSGEGIDAAEILELLVHLVSKSFVAADRRTGGERRYYLLETIRQYGQERLREEGELDFYLDRHLAYFIRLAQESEPKLVRAEQGAWIRKLTGELDNLRTALLRARDTDPASGLRLILTMWRFWNYGLMVEGEQWIEQFRAIAGEALDLSLKAKSLWVQSRFNIWPVMKIQVARTLAEEGLAIYRELDDERGIARCLMVVGWTYYFETPAKYLELLGQSIEMFRKIEDPVELGEVLFWYGFFYETIDLERSRLYSNESLALFREVGHLAGIIRLLENSAQLSIFHGDYETARSRMEESLTIHRALGERGASQTAEILGHLSYRTGDYESAEQYLSTSLALSKQSGEKLMHYWATARMGHFALIRGDFEEAMACLISSLRSFKSVNVPNGIAFAVECLAILFGRLNQAEKAAKLIGWADKVREEIVEKRPPTEEEDIDREKRAIIEAIGEKAYQAAYDEGRLLTPDQVFDWATSGLSLG